MPSKTPPHRSIVFNRGDIVDAADCEDPIQAESPSNALIGYLRASLPTIVLLGVA